MVAPAQTTTRATTLARVLTALLERIVKHVREGANKMPNVYWAEILLG